MLQTDFPWAKNGYTSVACTSLSQTLSSLLPQILTHPQMRSVGVVPACPTERSFSSVSQNAYVNINRIMSVASRLSEAGHYASQQIKQISTQLDQEWKSFAAALDERSTILAMSAVFHQKAEQVRPRELLWWLLLGRVGIHTLSV